MNIIPTYDALIVGGGPAGSTCASVLVKAGLKTLLVDSSPFPRTKLCAGWLSAPVWEVLELSPTDYTGGLWTWNTVHIHFRGRQYSLKSAGYFIRRYEFDDFLLKRSRVELVENHRVKQIARDQEGYWVIDGLYRARFLVGAGGSYCPVARALFPKPDNLPCGTQEREWAGSLADIAACRPGQDGEPTIYLHDNLKGYSWNVPKGEWLNVGTGTTVAREVVPAWRRARAFFEGDGAPASIPDTLRPDLDKMKGHGYINFHPNRLEVCQRDNAFLVGDALGLAQPMTGEGILPALLSGKICAEAIVAGNPTLYGQRLGHHPIIRDYRSLHQIQKLVKKIIGSPKTGSQPPGAVDKLIVRVFAFLFSGRRLPGSRILARLS
jgi:flavin-dependent dehydrogenase